MIKLLIVDDEQIEREGMQAILRKAFPETKIEQAHNGKMAIQKTEEFHPDLVLMDIKMPGMNGLEAVEQILDQYPNTKFIMVTAYDMVDYLRAAIKLGVKDYLLKPSKTSEIIQTVGKVIELIEEEKKEVEKNKIQQEAFQKTLALVETDVVTQLLFDHVHEVHVDMLVEMLDIQSINEMFVMLVLLPNNSENLYISVKEKVRKSGSGWVGPLYGNQLPVIVFRNPDRSFRSQAIQLARDVLTLDKGNPGEWFIGIGTVCDSLDLVRQSYHDSLLATIDTTLPVKYRFYSDVPAMEGNKEFIQYREDDFTNHIRLGHWEHVQSSVHNLINSFEKEGASLIQAQQRVMEVLWVISRIMSEMGIETITPLYSFQTQDYRQLRTEAEVILEKMKGSHEEHYNHIEADTMKQIKQYISEHSHEEISLETLGKKVGLSPIYISKMFKEKLGVNYIDYLTECRIEKAKRLMCDPEKSIKEITFEVGYHEPNYFSKVFKKVCNVSPKEYRKTLLGTGKEKTL
jgi:two-component system, response regulator YesN